MTRTTVKVEIEHLGPEERDGIVCRGSEVVGMTFKSDAGSPILAVIKAAYSLNCSDHVEALSGERFAAIVVGELLCDPVRLIDCISHEYDFGLDAGEAQEEWEPFIELAKKIREEKILKG